MDLYTAILERHSVRAYKNQPIEAEKVQKLQAKIDTCNREEICICSWSPTSRTPSRE